MPGKFVIKKTSNGEFRFTLQAGNGEKVLASETYKAKAGALNGVESVKKNAPNDARYEKKAAKNGKAMFNLKAGNGEIIGTSEQYSSEAARDKGIAAVKSAAAGATTDDQTG